MDEATFTGRGHLPAATALDVVCASSVTSHWVLILNPDRPSPASPA